MIGDVTFFNKSTGEQLTTTTKNIETTMMINHIREFGINSQNPSTAFRCGVLCADMGRTISHIKSLEEFRTDYDKQVINNILDVYSDLLNIEFTEESFKEYITQIGETFYDDENIITLNMV